MKSTLTRRRKSHNEKLDPPLRFCKRISDYPHTTGAAERDAKQRLAELLEMALGRQADRWAW
jgi:hypothetical protein